MIVERIKKALEIEKDADRDFKNLCEYWLYVHLNKFLNLNLY